MDSCGVGAAPDAADYGNAGTDTLGHTAEAVGGLTLPNLQAAGLGNLHGQVKGMSPATSPSMAFGKMQRSLTGDRFNHRPLGNRWRGDHRCHEHLHRYGFSRRAR